MTHDFDVCVIGGGPAGIAAAVRARWVKRHHALACKVAIVDPSPLGGLAAMGSTVLTGLHFQMSSEQILGKLKSDVEELALPHIKDRVARVDAGPHGVRLELDSGATLTCRAAVIACGMRALSNEAEFWGRGVTGLSMGIDHVVSTLQQLATADSHRRIVFVGSAGVLRLRPILEAARRDDRVFDYVIEPIAGITDGSAPDGAIVGSVEALEGRGALSRVRIRRPDGTRLLLEEVDLFVMDFLSLEAQPARSLTAPELAVDADGFIQIDRRCRTSLAGVFAAGDATGMPACVAKAFGEGVVAGLEAYRYVYRQKLGAEPQLFAYYSWQGDLATFPGELPPVWGHGLRLEVIGDREEVGAHLAAEHAPEELKRQLLSGTPRTVEAIADAAGLPLERAAAAARGLLVRKLATLR